MFRLVVGVRRGSASGMPGAWERYPTLEQARKAAVVLLGHERVTRIAVIRNDLPPAFVEWLERLPTADSTRSPCQVPEYPRQFRHHAAPFVTSPNRD